MSFRAKLSEYEIAIQQAFEGEDAVTLKGLYVLFLASAFAIVFLIGGSVTYFLLNAMLYSTVEVHVPWTTSTACFISFYLVSAWIRGI
jgi:hypothetical protein